MNEFSKYTLYLEVRFQEGHTPENRVSATGLLLRCSGRLFLVTNWHVVSGRHPKTRELDSAEPTELRIHYRLRDRRSGLLVTQIKDEPLVAEGVGPLWIQHDTRDLSENEDEKLAIDVALLPLSRLSSVDDDLALNWNQRLPAPPFVQVGSDIAIVGYPMNRFGVKDFPVWKGGHIASDIDAHPDGKHFLVDSVTREGMSGSPVVVRNTLSPLIGIYSGRLERDVELGIGIVWRAHLIDELLQKYFANRK